MQLYTFKAPSLAAALRLVRDELGPGASVLHTRDVSSLAARLVGARTIEVTASTELEAPSRLPIAPTGPVAVVAERQSAFVPAAELHGFRDRFRQNLAACEDAEMSLVERLALASAEEVQQLAPRADNLAARLEQAGVCGGIARRWLERLTSECRCDEPCVGQQTGACLRQIVAGDLNVCGPFQCSGSQRQVIALVGPTGVGKTTTAAKLAAHFHLHEQRRVALITVDTFRIAASLQLQTYAQIMALPMEVVATGGEMAAAIRRFGQHDLLLIDTAGISPHDEPRISELRSLLATAAPHETALVLSSTSDAASMRAAADALTDFGITNLILTKLDEMPRPGAIAERLAACPLPVSYLTNGQNVPADIEPASANRLAELILSQSPRTAPATPDS